MSLLKKRRIVIAMAIVVAVGLLLSVISKYVIFPGNVTATFSLEDASQSLAPFLGYERGVIEKVLSDASTGPHNTDQQLAVKLLTGEHVGDTFTTRYQNPIGVPAKFRAGDIVVLGLISYANTNEYVIVEGYRLPWVLGVLAVFVLLILAVAWWRGFAALVALAFSVAVLIFGIAPNILIGRDPVVVSLVGSFIILLVTMLLGHGFNSRTYLALVGSGFAFAVGQGLAVAAVNVTQLFGAGTESAVFLQAGLFGNINLKGLLLAGIMIGTLGVLDDVTTTQVASIQELSQANPSYRFRALVKGGMSIGRDHIAAVINTLALAYAGVALPFILLMVANTTQPLWVILNSEEIVEELIRTLAGSAALILAVPLTTFLAAWFYTRKTSHEQAI